MTSPKPQYKSPIQQLREILQLPPTLADDQVLEQSRQFNSQLDLNDQLNKETRDKFLAAYKTAIQVTGAVEKREDVADQQYQQWMKQETRDHHKAIVFAMALSYVNAKDKAEEEEEAYREFIEVNPEERENYQPLSENSPAPTLSQQQKVDDLNDVLKNDLRLLGEGVRAIIEQRDGIKNIMLLGVTPENIKAVREVLKEGDYALRDAFNPQPPMSGKKTEDEETPVFNPRPKIFDSGK